MRKWLKKQEGFTLVEAIVSVAIVGIIVTPIAMVFQGALNSVTETREQIQATQMAQACIENLKTQSLLEIQNLEADSILDDSELGLLGIDHSQHNFVYELDLVALEDNDLANSANVYKVPDYIDIMDSVKYDIYVRYEDDQGIQKVKIYRMDHTVTPATVLQVSSGLFSVSEDMDIILEQKVDGSLVYSLAIANTSDPLTATNSIQIPILAANKKETIVIESYSDREYLPTEMNKIQIKNLTDTSYATNINVYEFVNLDYDITDIVQTYGQSTVVEGLAPITASPQKIFELHLTVKNQNGEVLTAVETTYIAN